MNVTTTWYPIETAPTDGREVLLYCAKWKRPVMISDYGELLKIGRDHPDDVNWPTHWMHIPDPPAAALKG